MPASAPRLLSVDNHWIVVGIEGRNLVRIQLAGGGDLLVADEVRNLPGETEEAISRLREAKSLWEGMKAAPPVADIDTLLARVERGAPWQQ